VRAPSVLHEPQFRLLFAGQAVSVLGDRLAPIALAFAVLRLDAHPSALGLVLAAQTLPMALLVLVGGVYADRLPRQRVMLASDLVRAAAQATTAALLLAGAAQVWMLAALAAVYGTAQAFFQPAAAGLVPQTVPARRIQDASALMAMTHSIGIVVGPAAAGAIIALLSPGTAIAIDAVSFLVSAMFLARMSPRPLAARDGEPPGNFRAQLAGGWREVRVRPWLWTFLLALAAYHLVVLPAVFVGGPIVAETRLHGASSWAAIMASFGVGTVAGTMIAMRVRPRRRMVAATAALVVGSCQAAIIGSGGSTTLIAALEALTGVGVALAFIFWETTLAEQISPHALARVTSFDFLLSFGLLAVGMVLAGPVIAAAGLTETLVAETVIGVALALVALAAPSTRRLRPAAE
jgi:MFS family permease